MATFVNEAALQKPEDALSSYFLPDDASTGYCRAWSVPKPMSLVCAIAVASRKGSTVKIGVFDNELGFCVLFTGLLDGVTFIHIIEFAFGASSTTR